MRVIRYPAIAAVVALPLVSMSAAGDPYQPVRALVAALGLGVGLLAARDPGRQRTLRLSVVALGVLLAWSLLAALAGEPASSLFGVHGRFQGVASLTLSACAGVAGLVAFSRWGRFVARGLVIAMVLESVVVIYQSLAGAVPWGTVGNQVLVGAWMAIGVAVALAAARVETGRWRATFLGGAAIGAVALGLIGSRGAWVGLAAGVAVVVASGAVRRRTLVTVAVLAVLLVGAGLLAGGETASKLDPASLARGSAAARWQIWSGTTALIADNPILGVGPGRFLYEYPAYQTLDHALAEGPDIRSDVAHSHVLQTAAEAGVPAAVALVVLAGLVLFAGATAARRGDAIALIATAGFAAYLGQGIFGIGAIETDVLGWLLGGIALFRGTRVPDSAQVESQRWITGLRVGGIVMSVILAGTAGYYLWADVSYGSGLDAFSQARFDDSYMSHVRAIDRDPLIDVYRVGATDAALYGGGARSRALEIVNEGLALEPRSYDLALARARVLRSTEAAPDDVIAAYAVAADLYPLCVEVRVEMIPLLLESGYDSEAAELARTVLKQVPDDPVAAAVVGDDG